MSLDSGDKEGDIKFRIAHAEAFWIVMKILNDFCEIVNFEFSKEGLNIVATDSTLFSPN